MSDNVDGNTSGHEDIVRDREHNPLYVYEGYGIREYRAESAKHTEIFEATGTRPETSPEMAEYFGLMYSDIHRTAPEEAKRYDRILTEALETLDVPKNRGRWNIETEYRQVSIKYVDYYENLYEIPDDEVRKELADRLTEYGDYLDKAGKIADLMDAIVSKDYPDYEAVYRESCRLEADVLGYSINRELNREIEHLALVMAGGHKDAIPTREIVNRTLRQFYLTEKDAIIQYRKMKEALERIEALRSGPHAELIGYISDSSVFKWVNPRDQYDVGLKACYISEIYDYLTKKSLIEKAAENPRKYTAQIKAAIREIDAEREKKAGELEALIESDTKPEGPTTESLSKQFPSFKPDPDEKRTIPINQGWNNLNWDRFNWKPETPEQSSLDDFLRAKHLVPMNRERHIEYKAEYREFRKEIDALDVALMGTLTAMLREQHPYEWSNKNRKAPYTFREDDIIRRLLRLSPNTIVTTEQREDLFRRITNLKGGWYVVDLRPVLETTDGLKDVLKRENEGSARVMLSPFKGDIIEYPDAGADTMTRWYVVDEFPATEWVDKILNQSTLVPYELKETPKLNIDHMTPDVVKKLEILEGAKINLWRNQGKGSESRRGRENQTPYISLAANEEMAALIDIILREISFKRKSGAKFTLHIDRIIEKTWGSGEVSNNDKKKRRRYVLTYLTYLMNRPDLSGIKDFKVNQQRGKPWTVDIIMTGETDDLTRVCTA